MEERDLSYIINAHTNKVRPEASNVRKWDGKTPYYLHPIWCASMIRFDTTLPEELRIAGSQALLYHDILEDTTEELPEWIPQDVIALINGLTFKNSEDEWENLWTRNKKIRLLKLYDKTNNMMDSSYMIPERREQHLAHLRRLYEDVEKNYGKLNITRLARTLF